MSRVWPVYTFLAHGNEAVRKIEIKKIVPRIIESGITVSELMTVNMYSIVVYRAEGETVVTLSTVWYGKIQEKVYSSS